MSDAVGLYLDLMKRCLTNWLWGDAEEVPLPPHEFLKPELLGPCLARGVRVVRPQPFDPAARREGRDWPPTALTMVGLRRLDNVQLCMEDVLHRQVPGDMIETGVWRGGTAILMRAVLKAYGVTDRRVWLADSFAGLPPPDVSRYPQDAGWNLHTVGFLAVSQDQVAANFRRFGLLDEQVCFLKGWFRDTLPAAPIERLAVLRLDGDLYESTIEALAALYPKLSTGGYVIIDDYGNIAPCRQAVHDYRQQQQIHDPIQPIDGWGVFWQRSD